MGFRTVCIESRCKCSYASGYLVVTDSERTTRIHLSEIALVLFSNTRAVVSAYLMSELASAKIPVVFCDDRYLPVAECLPIHGAYNGSARVAEQISWSQPRKKRLWQRIVKDKIELQAHVLQLNGKEAAAEALRRNAATVRSGDPDNREAVAAAIYFAALFGTTFKRGLECPLNATLDYGYGVLLSKVAREIASRGYLTQIGVHHRGEFNPWNLACDFMEPFRPHVDAVVVRGDPERFDTETRRRLASSFDDIVWYEDGRYKLSSVIRYYVRDCLDVLEGDKEPSEVKVYRFL